MLQLVAGTGKVDSTMAEVSPPCGGGVAGVAGIGIVLFEIVAIARGERCEGTRSAGRERKQVEAPRGGGRCWARGRQRRLADDYVGIGPAESKGTDAGETRPRSALPVFAVDWNFDGDPHPIDVGVERREVQVRAECARAEARAPP